MRYADARPLIRSGDLLVWCGAKGGVSRLIRCWTGGSWSHVGLAWRYQDRVFVIEAREGRGIQLQALSAAVPVDWIATGAAWTDAVEQAALDRLGLLYSYMDVVRVGSWHPAASGWRDLLHLRGDDPAAGGRFGPYRCALTGSARHGAA